MPGLFDCDAYGNTQIFNSGSTRIYNPKCEFIFTGRRFDPETSNATTQMYFYRARYYSPVLGRFISRDPIGYGSGMNLYEYVGGMAVGAVDPMGLVIMGPDLSGLWDWLFGRKTPKKPKPPKVCVSRGASN